MVNEQYNLEFSEGLFPFSSPKAIALPKFPATRFQGSKRKILDELATAIEATDSHRVLDMFSGSGIVTLMLRYINKEVSSNDFMLYNQNTARLFQSYSPEKINLKAAKNDLEDLLYTQELKSSALVSETYANVYFTDEENTQIDKFCQNIHSFSEHKRQLYTYAIGQALIKKRPYNLFHRANLDMRLKDVKRSFGNKKTWETPIVDHALKCIRELQVFPINAKPCESVFGNNSSDLNMFNESYDLIYLDPPYINGKGAPVDYSNFYHFLEGLCQYDLFEDADEEYPHKPIVKKYSAWSKKDTALQELTKICEKWRNSTIFLSYRSDGVPSPDEALEAMSVNGRRAEIHSAGEYKYALSKTDKNEELFIVSKPN